MSVNGRELNKKERKACTRKTYIYLIMIIQNAVFAYLLGLEFDEISSMMDYGWLYPLFFVTSLITDIFFIKVKNFKYVCRSYRRDDDDTFGRMPNSSIQFVDPEAQAAMNAQMYMRPGMQQPGVIAQPGMMQQQPGMMQPQPGMMQPGMMQPQPGMMQPQPGMMQAQPGMM